MGILQILARTIIKKSFHVSVWTIEQFHDIAIYEQKARQLQELPDGTLGKDIANCLEKNNLRLVPNYESHDLKHVLLDFKMTPVDEIRMQAFMLGNGNYSIPSFAIFFFGAILLPDLWRTFYKDYKNGLNSKPNLKVDLIKVYRDDQDGYENINADLCIFRRGASAGKEKRFDTHTQTYKIVVEDKSKVEEVKNTILSFNWSGYKKHQSAPSLSKNDIYRLFKTF